MKIFVVISLFAMALSAQANPLPRPRPGHPHPHPRPVPPAPAQREQVLLRDINQQFAGASRAIPLRQYLDLPRGTQLNSVIVIASSPSPAPGEIRVTWEGRELVQRRLGQRLEVVQVPVTDGEWHERLSLDLVTRGDVYVAQIGATFYGTYVPAPAPYPHPAPAPVAPACKLLGAGAYNGIYWSFRVAINGQVTEGANNLDQALVRMHKLAEMGMCAPAPEQLSLLGAGAYNGVYYNFRLQLGTEVLAGANDLDGMLRVSARLVNESLGYTNGARRCAVLPAGAYRGIYWAHRVTIGDDVIDGANNLDQAMAKIRDLRNAGYCQ